MQQTRNILITGASSGIGEALALHYADQHSRLILLARNLEKLENVAAKCQSKQAQTSLHSVDVTDTETLQETITKIDAEYPIDLIICNAGVTSFIGENGEAESWETLCKVVDTNLYGVLASLNPLITHMQQRRSGQIAIISSLAAFYGMPVTPAYCASKSAVKGYGESLRGWLRPFGIKVSMVYPGFVQSELSDKFNAPKPFLLTTEKAAEVIANGIDKNKPSISFPFPLNFGIWLLSVLPARASDWIMSKLYKAGKD